MDVHVMSLLEAWQQAERDGDVAALSDLSTDDFSMVGPFGFLLDKEAWLERYRSGDLVTKSIDYSVDVSRRLKPAWIIVGTLALDATHRGWPAGGEFRTSHFVDREGTKPALKFLHLSLRRPPQKEGE